MPTGFKPAPGELSKALANVIRAHMGFANMSQADLSRTTGIPAGTISRLVRGEKEMDLNQFRLICDALGQTMSSIMVQAEEVVRGGEGANVVVARLRQP